MTLEPGLHDRADEFDIAHDLGQLRLGEVAALHTDSRQVGDVRRVNPELIPTAARADSGTGIPKSVDF
jgi:hypothetical protein